MPGGQKIRRQSRLTRAGRAGLLAQSYGFGEGAERTDQADARAGSCQASSASASASVT